MKAPFLASAGNPAMPGAQSSDPAGSPIYTPQQAPAGPNFAPGELPVVAVPGGSPGSLSGFSPEPGNPPLPDPNDPCDGCGTAPSGLRR